MKNLNFLYHVCLNRYNVTGEREHPSHLLAMLLLQEKNNYEPLRVSEGNSMNIIKNK